MADFTPTLGATYQGGGQTRFRVWAPDRSSVEVCLEGGADARYLPLERRPGGYHEGLHPCPPGTRYRFRLDRDGRFPDPCSRFQPDGPHGPSVVVDPGTFRWSDQGWKGLSPKGQVIYEVHVGTFTKEGTFAALEKELPYLAALGITALELMPIATFPGRFNWGYDGVGLFAPCAVYGDPDDLRRLVDAAHQHKLGVILDVVYNHLGPDGNYLAQFTKAYFTDRYPAEWGTPLAFEGEQARPVREFFAENAAYWISEFHFDGLRLDATQNLFDASPKHVVSEIADSARRAAPARSILLIAENEPQDLRFATPSSQGGHGTDAIWVDDFHHSARVAYAGCAEAYCKDYRGTAQELLSCILRNSLYQGQWYLWQGKPRGTPLFDLPAHRVVFFLQNHDQVPNLLNGQRFQVFAGDRLARAFTALLLLAPQTPLLFMGQEYFATTPFLYFTDHSPPLQAAVAKGRAEYLKQFPSAKRAIDHEGYRVPIGEEAFAASKLSFEERDRHRAALVLHRELIALRRSDPVFAAQDLSRIVGATLHNHALVLRYFGGPERGDRLLILNLGSDLAFSPSPEPLLAPPPGTAWRPTLSSEETRFGGAGAIFPETANGWNIQGQTTTVLRSEGASGG